jgi:hypothetical protein
MFEHKDNIYMVLELQVRKKISKHFETKSVEYSCVL